MPTPSACPGTSWFPLHLALHPIASSESPGAACDVDLAPCCLCRSDHATARVGPLLFVLGGRDAGGTELADLWQLDMRNGALTERTVARSAHAGGDGSDGGGGSGRGGDTGGGGTATGSVSSRGANGGGDADIYDTGRERCSGGAGVGCSGGADDVRGLPACAGHTMAAVGVHLIVVGGQLADGRRVSVLWVLHSAADLDATHSTVLMHLQANMFMSFE